MLGLFKKALGDNVRKFSGQKDFLEAVCAAAALIAAADGEIEDSEIDGLLRTISANPALSGAFNAREIETCAQAMFDRATKGRMGRMGLEREIEEATATDADKAEAVLLAALDVSEADGQIEPEEMKVLERLASKLKLDLKRYL